MRIAQALFCDARVAGSTLMQQHILCFTLKQIWLRTNNSEEKKAWEELFWRRGPGEATWQRGQGTRVISLHGHPSKMTLSHPILSHHSWSSTNNKTFIISTYTLQFLLKYF
jgi:hypothetical protein